MKTLTKRNFLKIPALMIGALICGINKIWAVGDNKIHKINNIMRLRRWRLKTGLMLAEIDHESKLIQLPFENIYDKIEIIPFRIEGTQTELIQKICIQLINLFAVAEQGEKNTNTLFWEFKHKYQPIFDHLDKLIQKEKNEEKLFFGLSGK